MNIQQHNSAEYNSTRITFLRGLFALVVVFSFVFAGSSNYAYASKTGGKTAEGDVNTELREEFYPLNFPGVHPVYVPSETEESITRLEEKHGIKVPDLLRDIYAKRVDIEKLGYIGKAEGEILVSVFPCLSKSDK
ncbi:MAG: hypothetical protein LBI63_00385, partial [Candidatus Ancillula sp.]|nr:hypothetical protein [Candidatus Ancillula sp.]